MYSLTILMKYFLKENKLTRVLYGLVNHLYYEYFFVQLKYNNIWYIVHYLKYTNNIHAHFFFVNCCFI